MAEKRNITPALIRQHLKKVIDPELHVDIVGLGLIYDVQVGEKEVDGKSQPLVYIKMTLTTPGCPLAGVFDTMVRDSLRGIEGLDADKQVNIELTFDPPWIPDLMDEETKAELGF